MSSNQKLNEALKKSFQVYIFFFFNFFYSYVIFYEIWKVLYVGIGMVTN